MTAVRPPRRAENALLLAVARCPAPGEFDADRARALDWPYLARAADRQGLTPLLDDWLAHRPTVAVPADVRAALHSTAWAAHFRNKALLRELARVLRAASARGIALMPLKGALLAPCYYPASGLRPLSDLDLLVRPGDFAGLAEVLRDLGHRELPGPPSLLDEGRRDPSRRERAFAVERQGMELLIEYRDEALDPMVWQLTDLDPALVAGLRRHAARAWAHARPGTLGEAEGAPFARQAPEDLLLHLASHLTTRHADLRLLWLHDLCRVAAAHPDLDWDDLAREARALHLGTPVFAALQAARRRLGAPIPLRQIAPAFLGRAWYRRPPLELAEHALLSRRQRALGTADLASPPPGEIARQVTSLARLHGLAPRLRALRWIAVPGQTYTFGWRGAHSDAGYATTVALRLAILALQGVAAASGGLRLRPLARAAARLAARIERAARLDPFARYAMRDGGGDTPPGGA